jgi:hypothetical protein
MVGISRSLTSEADVDAAVLIRVLVSPIVQILLLQFEALGIGVHHELVARPGEDQDLVLRVGADGLEHLPDRPVVLDAELDRPTVGMCLYENDAVLPALHLVEILEALFVLFELRRLDEAWSMT